MEKLSKFPLTRKDHFMPFGTPRKIRCYDNGEESFDRYTVVFTGTFKGRNGRCYYLALSEHPFSPQGFGQHGDSNNIIDYPSYKHLGKKIPFCMLPLDCQKIVVDDYMDIWQLKEGKRK